MQFEWAKQVQEWSRPPVDGIGYISSSELLAMPDDDFRDLIDRMWIVRYKMERNHGNLWREVMGLDSLHDKNILDFGCGVGIESLELVRSGNRVSLADLSSENLQLAARTVRLIDSKWHEVDVYVVRDEPPFIDDPLHGPFDVFYCNGVLHHIPWAREIMQRAHGLLRPGGEVRLMVYSDEGWRIATGTEPPADTPADPGFAQFVRFFDAVGHYADWYDAGKLEDWFGAWFVVERCEYLTPDRRYLGAVLRKREA